MDASMLLMGLVPLIAFVIVDTFAGIRAGVVAAVIFAIGELSYSLYKFHDVDIVTGFSFALVLAMAAISYKTKNALFFKLQPVWVELTMAGFMLVTAWMGEPILVTMMTKYKEELTGMVRGGLSYKQILPIMAKANTTCGWAILAHALLVAYAAIRCSKWTWLVIKGIGVYVFLAIGMMAALIMQ